MKSRACRNPQCREAFAYWLHPAPAFCPSCRWIGKRAFALGSLLAGILAWWFR